MKARRMLVMAAAATMLGASACAGTTAPSGPAPGTTGSPSELGPSPASRRPSPPAPPPFTSTSTSTTPPPSTSPTPTAAPGADPSRRPAWSGAVRLAPGERPPQFIVVSFDGASWHPLMQHWLSIAEDAHATMTLFLSGIYLVPRERASQLYHPPGHAAGASSIGFSTVPDIRTEIGDLRRAHVAGHEIGTHFNGHFCGPDGVNRWSQAQWTAEITQFNAFLDQWAVNAGITDLAPLPFSSADIQGGRTPCLEGRTTPLLAAERSAGFRYDASRTGLLRWPTKLHGLWEFPLPSIRLAGTGQTVLAMDYNFYYVQSRAVPAPASSRPAMRRQVLTSYQQAFRAVYTGNRAPLIIGGHFNRWNGGIYTDALTDFLLQACSEPGVQCVSFSQLADWLDAQEPATVTRLQALPVTW